MSQLPSHVQARALAVILAAVLATPPAHAATNADAGATVARQASVDPSVRFATPADTATFLKMWQKLHAAPVPDPRRVARDFIRQTLQIDGDAYVVAYFADREHRDRGAPEHTMSLTDALLEAFPDHSRHTFFAGLSDGVGGVFGGGRKSQDVVAFADSLWHSGGTKDFFSKLGLFLWSRTGPGYLYNTFIADGNVVQTVAEDARPLDDAFAIYRVGGFTADHASSYRLSQLVASFGASNAFAELPYVRDLNGALDRYWNDVRADWPVLARYEFVRQARRARDARYLTQAHYELVMRAGAPLVPLQGPVTLAQLRASPPPESVAVRRFDINGYAATDLVRFVAADQSEVMYVPGAEDPFVVASSEADLRRWVLAQAEDPDTLDALLAHFSIYDGQDGVFWTGVKHGLEKLGDGEWQADGASIDHVNGVVTGDVFEDMREHVEKRLRDDASMQVSTAWEAWRTTINRAVTLLLPIGFVRPLALPVQVATSVVTLGTGVDQGVDGKTFEERKAGLEGAVSTLLNNAATAAATPDTPSETSPEPSAWFTLPRRTNGQLGYPLSPTSPPRLVEAPGWYYARPDGRLARWVASDARDNTLADRPPGLRSQDDGTFLASLGRYVDMGARWARVVSDPAGYRLVLRNGEAGPVLRRLSEGGWGFAVDIEVKGSILTQVVPSSLTSDSLTLVRASEVLDQLGEREVDLPTKYGFTDAGEATNPLLILALGHGFIETLSARLRHPSSGPWSVREERLLGPHLAYEVGRPLAIFDETGAFEWAVDRDGTSLAANEVPATAVSVHRVAGAFVPSEGLWRGAPSASLLGAVADAYGASQPQPAAPGAWEPIFSRALAHRIDAQPAQARLERMHRVWLAQVGLPRKQVATLEAISFLRYAIAHDEPLTDVQRKRLSEAAEGWPAAPADAREYAKRTLAKVVQRKSAFLPAALNHLLVKVPSILARARGQSVDEWAEGGRHYVRLRRLDGRGQVVETSPPTGRPFREILAPGDGANRGTGWFLFEDDDMWRPSPDLDEGFVPSDPRAFVRVMTAVARRLPASARFDVVSAMGIADGIPPPLLRYFDAHLTSLEVAPGGSVALFAEHPATLMPMRYLTQVDINGRALPPMPLPSVARPPAVLEPARQLVLPLPEGAPGVRHGPMPDPSLYQGLLREQRPISAFIEAGVGDRHVKTLVNTRRLRGMVREDTHLVVVGGMSEHAVTLLMPVTPIALDLVSPGAEAIRSVHDLPAGAVIVDEMYDIASSAAGYPAQVREVAARWAAVGARMKRFRADGTPEWEPIVAFTERMLSEPLRINLWNPGHDPISEQRYVEYMRRRRDIGDPVRHAGLDWLQTWEARRDYMGYFAPPYDIQLDGRLPPSTDLIAMKMHGLLKVALGAALAPLPLPTETPPVR